MTEALKQIIEKRLLELPKEVGEVINSFDWIEKSKTIGQKYFLDEKEIDILQFEISTIFLGLVSPEEFESNIEENVGLSSKEASIIDEEIGETIFKPIFEQIAKKMNIDMTPEKEEGPKPEWQENLDFIFAGENSTMGE